VQQLPKLRAPKNCYADIAVSLKIQDQRSYCIRRALNSETIRIGISNADICVIIAAGCCCCCCLVLWSNQRFVWLLFNPVSYILSLDTWQRLRVNAKCLRCCRQSETTMHQPTPPTRRFQHLQKHLLYENEMGWNELKHDITLDKMKTNGGVLQWLKSSAN